MATCGLRKRSTTMTSGLRRLIFFTGLIGLWAIVAKLNIWDSTLFPSPWKVAATLGSTIADGQLLNATAVSLRRVLMGYAISLAVAIPLGVLLARKPFLEDTVGALVVGFQSLPSICWLPIAMLWFGLNDRAILFVIVMGSLVSITVAVQDGIKNLPP